MNETTSVPNHHADYPGFSGPSGFLAALSMIRRESDAQLAARLSAVGPADVVVDIGCGPGAAVRLAARLGATVTGVDPAPVMLRVARVLTLRRSAKVRYVEGSAEALPITDGYASVVWSTAAVHHWADLDAGLRETLRVLRSHGRFVAIEQQTQTGAHGLASHGWTDAQADAFADECRSLGFLEVRVEHNATRRRSTVCVIATAP